VGAPIEGAAVRRFSPFEDLGDDEVAVAARAMDKVALVSGESLFAEGDTGRSAYLVVAGEVDIRTAGNGEDHDLVTLGAGASLGQLSLLLDQPRSTSVVARSDVELWEITHPALHTGLDQGDAWANRFLLATAKALAERLGAVSEQLVALMDVGRPDREPPAVRVAELEQLRGRLFSEWSF
jgi:CRP-like cAMP-binding protein